MSAAVVVCLRVRRPQPPAEPAPEFVWAEGLSLDCQDKDAPPAGKSLLAARTQAGPARVTVDYPLDGSIFPPDIVAPTILWHDESDQADRWLIDVVLEDGAAHIYSLVNGPPPEVEASDPRCSAKTNEPPKLSPREASGHTWTPAPEVWEAIKKRSVGRTAQVVIYGVGKVRPDRLLSQGRVSLTTSRDPVGAPIFYRDVPLMPTEGKGGKIEPLAEEFLELVAWRLKDVSRPDSKVVLKDMPTCANCHSFSADGKVLGMDVDGPTGDKGAYAVARVRREMVLGEKEIMSWNSWSDKARTGKTIGFLSQVSPDGRFVLSTVNESVHVSNFTDYRFLQVFYPTRGILACYDTASGRIRPLPGADDPAYVQCDAAWSPDGQWVVFARAGAREAYPVGMQPPTQANDPRELPIQYDLWRVPFNGGAGGRPEPIAGASGNGQSNTFPKVSPDGKWIVFVQCRNGQLMRPDGTLWIVPAAGGTARRMNCNTALMNSWHSFSPNGRWMVFSSKARGPYTRAYLTHIDENGNDSPAILLTGMAAGNRAVNIPEFIKIAYDDLNRIATPTLEYWRAFQKGQRLFEKGQPTEAVEWFRQALATDPKSARLNAALANCLARCGRFRESLPYYDAALAVEPDDAVVVANRGDAYVNLRQLEKALADFDRAIRLRPDYGIAHGNRGSVLAQQGDRNGAMAAFSTALRHNPEIWWAWYNRGLLKEMMNDAAGALADLTRCLELAPADWPERAAVQESVNELRAAARPPTQPH